MALTTETAPIGLYASCDTKGCKTMAYSSYYDRYEEDIDLTDMRALNERAQHSHHESIEAFKEQGWEFARGQWHCPQHAVMERNLRAFREEASNPLKPVPNKPSVVDLNSETRQAPRTNTKPTIIVPRPKPPVGFTINNLGNPLP